MNIQCVLAHRQSNQQRLISGPTVPGEQINWRLPKSAQPDRQPHTDQERRTGEGDEVPHEILRQTRIARRWSQKALAFRLGITTDWLHKIECGKGIPNSELAVMINAWLADQNATGTRFKG